MEVPEGFCRGTESKELKIGPEVDDSLAKGKFIMTISIVELSHHLLNSLLCILISD